MHNDLEEAMLHNVIDAVNVLSIQEHRQCMYYRELYFLENYNNSKNKLIVYRDILSIQIATSHH